MRSADSGWVYSISNPPWTARIASMSKDCVLFGVSFWRPWFAVDTTAPDKPPTVSSTDYPVEGGTGEPGKPGQFTFTSNGVADVASFRYVLTGGGTSEIAADVLGGQAVATLTPNRVSGNTLEVRSRNADGQFSSAARENLRIPNSAPVVTSDVYGTSGPGGGPGVPGTFTFSTTMATVTEYRYSYDFGDEWVVVPAGRTARARPSSRPRKRARTTWRSPRATPTAWRPSRPTTASRPLLRTIR